MPQSERHIPTRDEIQKLLWGAAPEIRLSGFRVTGTGRAGATEFQNVTVSDGHEEINGCFIPPPSANAPAILYCHAHGHAYDIGQAEVMAGRPALARPYGPDLAALGFAVLCLDMPAFGARQNPGEDARAKAHAWHGRTLFGQMIGELQAAIGILAAHPQIDPARIGTLGISMGGTHAWWLAALDPRVAFSVDLCATADLGCLIDHGGHDLHGHYMTVPGLVSHCRTGVLAGLAAPKPKFVGVGLQDRLSPPPCFEAARKDLEAAYDGHADALTFHIAPDTGHQETPAMRRAVLDFLQDRGKALRA